MPTTIRSGMIARYQQPAPQPEGSDPGIPHDDRARIYLAGDDRPYYLPSDASSYVSWALPAAFAARRPVYIAATDGVIQDVRLPLVGRIRRMTRDEDGVIRAAIDSSAPWLLLPDDESAEQIRRVLEIAFDTLGILMVTTGANDTIVQAIEAPIDAWYLAPQFKLKGSQTVGEIPASVVSMADIDKAFAIVKEADCRISGSTSCVPFDYPDTGCDARAEQMCRALAEHGFTAGKVWVFDDDGHHMKIATHTAKGRCDIGWSFHVAVYVRLEKVNGEAGVYVLDPSLFDGPIRLSGFLAALHVSLPHFFSDAEAYAAFKDGAVGKAPGDEPEHTLEACRLLAAARNPQPPYCTKKI